MAPATVVSRRRPAPGHGATPQRHPPYGTGRVGACRLVAPQLVAVEPRPSAPQYRPAQPPHQALGSHHVAKPQEPQLNTTRTSTQPRFQPPGNAGEPVDEDRPKSPRDPSDPTAVGPTSAQHHRRPRRGSTSHPVEAPIASKTSDLGTPRNSAPGLPIVTERFSKAPPLHASGRRHRRRDRQHQPPPHSRTTTNTTRRPDVSIPITSDHFCVSADEPAVRLQLLARLLEQLTDNVITVATAARPTASRSPCSPTNRTTSRGTSTAPRSSTAPKNPTSPAGHPARRHHPHPRVVTDADEHLGAAAIGPSIGAPTAATPCRSVTASPAVRRCETCWWAHNRASSTPATSPPSIPRPQLPPARRARHGHRSTLSGGRAGP